MADTRRLPSMVDALEYIKKCDVPIDFILDVGILTCTYPLMQCFPSKKQFLVEPVRSFFPKIREIYDERKIDYTLVQCAAGSENDTLVLCEYGLDGGHVPTHSRIFKSPGEAPTANLIACVDIEVRKVDVIVRDVVAKEGSLPPTSSFLLKIDVDGTEEEILEGAREVLGRCSVVVLEVPIVKLLGRIQFLDQLGYQCTDIVEPCYYKGALSQVDCVFVRKDIYARLGVDPWSKGGSVDFSQWYEGRYVFAS
jgi:FkbM family methyltransferase